jgi:glycosyltransferase involved in cell wall biosynthesis
LKIGIDAFPLAGRIAGIGRYVLEICRALDEIMPEVDFHLYSPVSLSHDLPPRWQTKQVGRRFPSSYLWLKRDVVRACEQDGIDIFWATRTILPARSSSFRTVSTVHDLNYRVIPVSMPLVTRWTHRIWFARDLRRTDAVVANSYGTIDRLCDMLKVEACAVVRPGVGKPFGPQDQEIVAMRLSSLGVHQPYFLAVGTIEPRKNLPALVEAFVSLKREGVLPDHGLLIVGNSGWRNQRLQRLLEDAQAHDVCWLGFVSDDDLAALYAGSRAFVFPSLYEGFGIPAAEARACGAQVVASDLPELREAGGEDGIYVEPTVTGIREGLLLASKKSLAEKKKKLPSDWRSAAQVMADVFDRLV